VLASDTYTLRYTTPPGIHEHVTSAHGIRLIGQLAQNTADRGEAWDLQVLDRSGRDVTRTTFSDVFGPGYTVLYIDQGIRISRTLPAAGVERSGRALTARARRGEVWDLAVLDASGSDVTCDFEVFRQDGPEAVTAA
jgi:hypothetical protein